MLTEKMNAIFPLYHSIFFQPFPVFSLNVHITTELNGRSVFDTLTDNLFELLLDILTDDKYHMVEASLKRIMDS